MSIKLKLLFGITLFFLLLFSFFRAESKEQIKVEITARLNSAPPLAIDVKNFLIQNISGRSQILPLIGSDADGTIASFTILSLPSNAHGTLYLNNVAVTKNQVLNPVQAKQLQFEVKSTFTGTASFTYTVTDNNGNSAVSAATFSIPVTNDGTLLVCSGGGTWK